jgi:hypothetical protein
MTPKPKSARRLASARENGSQGGRERASRYSGEQLSAWASRGGEAVLHKYGPNYFVQLRKRRKNYPKYLESPVITPNWRARVAWQNGQRGGLARAARYSYEHFREWGRLGGIETWSATATSSIARSEKNGNITGRTISHEKPRCDFEGYANGGRGRPKARRLRGFGKLWPRRLRPSFPDDDTGDGLCFMIGPVRPVRLV